VTQRLVALPAGTFKKECRDEDRACGLTAAQ
jgi:hypothetical protein